MDHYEIAGIKVPYVGEELGVYVPVEDGWEYATIDLEKVKKAVEERGIEGFKMFVETTLLLAKHSAKANILEKNLGLEGKTGLEDVVNKRSPISNTIHFFDYIRKELEKSSKI